MENAGRPDARVLPGTVGDLGAAVAAAGFDGPVVLIVGEVTAQAAPMARPVPPLRSAG